MAKNVVAMQRAASDLYLDCQSGIAGDMLVAALLDLGADRAAMDRALASLPVSGFSVSVSRVAKAGIDCCDFDVKLDEAHDGHDHDMTYLHGKGDEASAGEQVCASPCGHAHGDDHCHGEGGHRHGRASHHVHACEHRNLEDIEAIITAADMTPAARARAIRAFRILAEAEAKAHALPVDQVHFHEVGAVDSIVDVVAAAVLIDSLGVRRAIIPVLADGRGTIRCQHGVIPVPVPATLNICIAHGLPLAQVPVEGELVTPTGAALVAALDPVFELPARYRVERIGLGAGKRAYSRPSILRALLVREMPSTRTTSEVQVSPASGAPVSCGGVPGAPDDPANAYVYKLECDLDDCSPEQMAYAADRLRVAGAREVHWLPIFSKKGRPAYQLQVICAQGDIDRLQLVVFRETTTIGIRRQRMERTCLPREESTVQTAFGPVRIKTVALPDGSRRSKPEFDDCAAVAVREGVPLREVAASAQAAIDD